MRKAAIVTIAGGALFGLGSFIPALATQNPAPQPGTSGPAYTNPCGSSAAQYPTGSGGGSTGPIGNPTIVPPSGASGASGIYGSNGYLELNGSAATQSGTISGELDNPPAQNNVIYGSLGGSAKSGGNICLGANGQTLVNQSL